MDTCLRDFNSEWELYVFFLFFFPSSIFVVVSTASAETEREREQINHQIDIRMNQDCYLTGPV